MMMSQSNTLTINPLITDHIDIWTSAILAKSTSGRGSNKKYELYGITKLRELILELAVRGKLVPQDSNDEPASALLDEIVAKKAILVKEKKIKKSKILAEVSIDDRPFELPLGWEWGRLGELAIKLTDGSHNPPKDTGKGYPMLSGQNVNFSKIDFDNPSRYVDLDGFEKENQRTAVKADDVLLTIVGSIGRSAVVPIDAPKFVLQRSVAVIDTPLNSEYLIKYFAAPVSLSYYDINAKGTAQKGIYLGQLSLMPIAIPPMAEQHRIVAKVDQLMLLCDDLEQQTEASIEAHATLVEVLLTTLTDSADANELAQNWARLSENFDSLFTTEQSIEALKQTVLQLAVMGKIVPQNPEDEPASVLIEKIAEEKEQLVKEKKIKKEKPLPAITDDERLFELPSGWDFSRLQQIIDVRDGTHDSPKDASGNNTFPLVTSKDFKDGSINFNTARSISEADHIKISQRSSVDYEDILFSMIGGNIGNQVMVLDTRPFSIKNVALFKYYNKKITIPKFVKLYTEFIAYQLQSSARGGAQPFVSLGYLRSLVFALPPINEQHCIVAKVNELMQICDQLRAKLKQSQVTQVQLTDALVEQALA